MSRIRRFFVSMVRGPRNIVDVSRTYGYPRKRKDAQLKAISDKYGTLINMRIFRRHQGQVPGRDYEKKTTPFTREDIIRNRQELKEKIQGR